MTTCGPASAGICPGSGTFSTLTGWNFWYAVARAHAGHIEGASETGATSTYVRASLAEVAAALTALTGEPHPLATAEGW
jgi:hypothetical protein